MRPVSATLPLRPLHLPGAPPLIAGASVLAWLLAQVAASPCEAGTVVRGRLVVPAARQSAAAAPDPTAVPSDPGDAVIYVTQPPGWRGKKLGTKGRQEEVALAGDRFTPMVVAVVVRSKVRFENRDRVYHNVFSVSPARRFDLGKLSPGADREVRFERPGVVQLFCEFHPRAAGFVVVCPNKVFARPSATGEYELPSLPRGPYVVHAWHPRLGSLRRSIEVSGRGDLALDLRF